MTYPSKNCFCALLYQSNNMWAFIGYHGVLIMNSSHGQINYWGNYEVDRSGSLSKDTSHEINYCVFVCLRICLGHRKSEVLKETRYFHVSLLIFSFFSVSFVSVSWVFFIPLRIHHLKKIFRQSAELTRENTEGIYKCTEYKHIEPVTHHRLAKELRGLNVKDMSSHRHWETERKKFLFSNEIKLLVWVHVMEIYACFSHSLINNRKQNDFLRLPCIYTV